MATKVDDKRFDELMKKADNHNSAGDHEKVLQVMSELEKLLESAGDKEPETWTWIYDYKRYSLYEVGRKNEAVAECHKAIEHIGKMALFPYLGEHSRFRATLRACHNMIAWELMESASSEEELLTALRHIKTCMDTISPIEPLHELNNFHDTHALILFKLFDRATDKEQYRRALYQAVKTLQQTRNPALNDEPLRAVVKSEEYQNFLMDDPLVALKKGAENESAEEALKRYEQALKLASTRISNLEEYNALERGEKVSPEDLKKYEESFGTIPGDMKQFFLQHGTFKIGDRKMFAMWNFFNRENKGLTNAIDSAWGGRPEFEEYYEQDQLAKLNDNYFVFGVEFLDDDNKQDYYYFDKNEKFGIVHFDQDYFDEAQECYFNPMLENSPARWSFDQLISNMVEDLIERVLLEYC